MHIEGIFDPWIVCFLLVLWFPCFGFFRNVVVGYVKDMTEFIPFHRLGNSNGILVIKKCQIIFIKVAFNQSVW